MTTHHLDHHLSSTRVGKPCVQSHPNPSPPRRMYHPVSYISELNPPKVIKRYLHMSSTTTHSSLSP
ncbi:hypothetical protein M413DRAFT_271974 [Hebeloma cylindrosporum]|uniref:Uncharacterized protein n=1 Tax=Hebeloma cylindrosporum TaxID=76867 RepID=A0A0C3CTS5_HEBCY|nr:hypothetical protein M413DRAFT_271974 [Hebeloma cylindrosporum h7]